MMLERMVEIGKKLEESCPDNDCVIYRNLYRIHTEIEEDRKNCKCESSKRALRLEQLRIERKLNDMYFHNYAVREYKKEVLKV